MCLFHSKKFVLSNFRFVLNHAVILITIFLKISKTRLIFLFQARAASALSTREGSVSALKNCWEILKCESISFVTLVTGAFPPPKVNLK